MRKVMSIVVSVCVLLCCLLPFPITSQAAELSGYQNESIVRFKNASTGKYLTVYGGGSANKTNIIQQSGTEDIADAPVSQLFQIQYNYADDDYHLRAMCSSSSVVDIVKNNGSLTNGCNIQLYSAVDDYAQSWTFSYEGDGKFAIIPANNIMTAITAIGTGNGGTGTSSTSNGNVCLINLPRGNGDYYSPIPDTQLWYIEEEYDESRKPFNSGYYNIKAQYRDELSNKDLTVVNNMTEDKVQVEPIIMSSRTNHERVGLIWRLEYLFGGYYLFIPGNQPDYALSCNQTAPDESGPEVTLKRNNGAQTDRDVMWKIIPNVTETGGTSHYRISSAGGQDSQVLTVLWEGAPQAVTGTELIQNGYVDSPRQQWSILQASLCYGVGDYADGHVVVAEFEDEDVIYYCDICGKEFTNPVLEDADKLPVEHYVAVLGLQRMFTVKMVEGNYEEADALLHIVDNIRSVYAVSPYSLSISGQNYYPVRKYSFLPSEYNFSVSVEVASVTEILHTVVYLDLLGEIPAPYMGFCSVFSELLALTVEESSPIEFFWALKEAVVGVGTHHLGKKFSAISNYSTIKDASGLLGEIISNTSIVNKLNNVVMENNIYQNNYVVFVTIRDAENAVAFYGGYRFNDLSQDDSIYVAAEELQQESTNSSAVNNYGKYYYITPNVNYVPQYRSIVFDRSEY